MRMHFRRRPPLSSHSPSSCVSVSTAELYDSYEPSRLRSSDCATAMEAPGAEMAGAERAERAGAEAADAGALEALEAGAPVGVDPEAPHAASRAANIASSER